MKKANDIAKMLASALLDDHKIYDENAETIIEISGKIGLGRWASSQKVSAAVKAGKLEKVWKRVGNRTLPAYRVKL